MKVSVGIQQAFRRGVDRGNVQDGLQAVLDLLEQEYEMTPREIQPEPRLCGAVLEGATGIVCRLAEHTTGQVHKNGNGVMWWDSASVPAEQRIPEVAERPTRFLAGHPITDEELVGIGIDPTSLATAWNDLSLGQKERAQAWIREQES